jgi:hypothetical protein
MYGVMECVCDGGEWQLRLTGVAVALNIVIELTDVAFDYARA